MKVSLVISLVTFWFHSYAQVILIDKCESNNGLLCGSSFRVYSDSIFINMSGCERRQSIEIGTYSHHADTARLFMIKLDIENFIDSIVFVPTTNPSNSTDTIDIMYYDKFHAFVWSENDMLTHLDSANYFVELTSNDSLWKRNGGVETYPRQMEYFIKHDEPMPESFPYSKSQTYLINEDVALGYILGDLFLWTGIKKVLEVPPNTREIHIYYSFSKEILIELIEYGVRLNQTKSGSLMSCNNKLYRFE